MNELEQVEQEMKDWENKNPELWKKAFNKRKKLLGEEDIVQEVKPKEESKPKQKPKEKVYAAEDVNKDGKVDLEDALDVVKKVFKKKRK